MQRRLIATELAKLFGVLAHPLRVQIVEELRDRELTVHDLQVALEVPHASVSQHLGILRSNRVVIERRQGRNVYYHLRDAALASLVIQFIQFLSPDSAESERMVSAIESVKTLWSSPE